MNVNRRFRNGFSFGVNYTWGIFFEGNTGLQQRFQHAADGSISVRSDEAQCEELNKTLDKRPHMMKANAVWNIPGTPESKGAVLGALTNGWQIAGVLTAGSGGGLHPRLQLPEPGRQCEHHGVAGLQRSGDPARRARQRMFGQPVRAVQRLGRPRAGLRQRAAWSRAATTCAAVRTSGSTWRSRGRSGFGGNRELEFRVDIFNAFNAVVINARNTTAQFNNPTSMTLVNNQFNADGSLNQGRVKPNNSGFGAATGAETLRNAQVQVRFRF